MSNSFDSLKIGENLCEQAYFYRNYLQINILQCSQILLAICSISMVFYLLKTEELKRLNAIIRPSLKIVVILGISIYVLGALFSFICYSYIMLINLLDLNSCRYVWTTLHCWLLRLPMYYCLVGYNAFHVSLLVERFCSAFFVERNKQSSNDGFSRWTGFLLGIFMVLLLPFLITLWVFGNEDLSKPRAYCLAGSVSAGDRIILFTKILFWFDLGAMFGDIFLLLYNRNQIKRRVHNFNLEHSFRLQEQQITIRYILPFTFIHSISFLIYLLFFSTNREFLNSGELDEKLKFFYGEVNSLSKALYVAVVPFALLIYGRLRSRGPNQWLRKQENHADAYFEAFQRQIK